MEKSLQCKKPIGKSAANAKTFRNEFSGRSKLRLVATQYAGGFGISKYVCGFWMHSYISSTGDQTRSGESESIRFDDVVT